ncbi:MAG: HAD hydrolase family protein [Oligoflexia bacterium]|nr:HAD hydrolase family protein [Oligoflexia bacterium]
MKKKAVSLKSIKVVIFDIDGVLTDGRIFYSDKIGWGAFYSVLDGYGIRQLQKNGIEVCFISGGAFESHKERAKTLKIRHAYFGNEDKVGAFETILKDLSVSEKECAYMGDELFDMPILERVGFAATVMHAPSKVKKLCHYVAKRPGGNGAARELCDLILSKRERV